MKQFLFFYSCMLFASSVIGQEYVETAPLTDTNLNIRLSQFRIDYPTGVNGEIFSNGVMDYRISEKLSARIENFYSKFGTNEQISSAFLFKWYIRQKLYLFAGTENEYGTNMFSGEQELLRVNLKLGVGYEIDEDFLLEMGYHPEVGRPKEDLLGRPITRQNSFSLRARF